MLKNRRRLIRQSQSGGIAGQLLGLSLFIMLLAFFIVLNSISSFDAAKVKPLSDSLEQVFATTPVTTTPLSLSLAQTDGKEPETLEQVEGLFRSRTANLQAVTSAQQGTMYIRLPRAEFEKIISAPSSGVEPPLLATLTSLLKTGEQEQAYRVEILYNLNDNPSRLANRKPAEMEAVIKAVAASAQKMESAGLPGQRLSVGLQKGNPDYVELVFRPDVMAVANAGPAGGQDD